MMDVETLMVDSAGRQPLKDILNEFNGKLACKYCLIE